LEGYNKSGMDTNHACGAAACWWKQLQALLTHERSPQYGVEGGRQTDVAPTHPPNKGVTSNNPFGDQGSSGNPELVQTCRQGQGQEVQGQSTALPATIRTEENRLHLLASIQ